ncbi:MAG TPA: energy transducer TonB [Pyrinomonadaceae bacterium]|nr:energy transducer TonB [Pyrinomonadaceae bacterium]
MNRIPSPRGVSPFSRLFLVFAFLFTLSVLARAQAPAEPSKSPAVDVPSEPAKSPADKSDTSPTPSDSVVYTDSAKTADDGEAFKAADALHSRIERARALVAAHRLDIAASELESVRAATKDSAFRNITSIMLMNIYLEEGNYSRAEALLEENFQARAAQKDESLGTYFALAGQAVNGARTHLARYRTFGISTSDAKLPAEALADLNRLRSLLERMITQAKEISNGRRAYDSLSLLEDVLGLRLSLAKDSEDQVNWASEYASAREALASSQTQIASLGGIPLLRPGRTTGKNPNAPSPYSTKKPAETPLTAKALDKDHASAEPKPGTGEPAAPSSAGAPSQNTSANATPSTSATNDSSDAGSLTGFATRKVVPRYPPMAKQTGAAGMVRVYLVVEGGKVIEVSRSEGPVMLRQAAEDAAKQWSFQVVSIEGKPTRLSGYIDFNFSL